jgi:DNA polymerase I-like protein with 3'-5' exonuclease and polymerase domains
MHSLTPLDNPRCSTWYNIAATDSYRLGSKKIFGEWGTNLQNLRKNIRSMFKVDNGYLMGNVDQAGAEAKIVAFLAPPGKYRKLFENNIKPHTYIALNVFASEWAEHVDPLLVQTACKCPIEELKNLEGWKELDKLIKSSDDWPGAQRYYYIGKKLAHSSNYGSGVNRFIMSVLEETQGAIVLDKKAATYYVNMFNELFPEIRLWHFIVQGILKKHKRLRNLYGYPHEFTGYIGESMYRDAYSFVPQSTVATITNIAYTKMQDYIESQDKDWHLLANTHDSYTMEFPEDESEDAMHKMREFMEANLIAPDGTPFQMKSEGQIGRNWGPYKPGKNEEGLREYKFRDN